jgi:hypothetical protein
VRGIPDELYQALEELGLETIVNIYCAIGEGFNQKIFKDQIRDMDVPAAATHKMYYCLQKWRSKAQDLRDAEAADKNNTSFSSNNSTSSNNSKNSKNNSQNDTLAVRTHASYYITCIL